MPQFPANIDLSSLDGTTGFKLSGVAAGDQSGFSVASAGDVNGDGFADVIVGARRADPHGNNSGASYVVFGEASGFGANIDLSILDGTTGFKLSGVANADTSGYSVASAGDVNGDGFADLIVGAPSADPNGDNSGASYVVFGLASGFAANVDLSTLNGTTGFRLSGVAAGDESGRSVASAGDVNGDGFADLIVGARLADPHANNSGASYVVFGKASGFAANVDLSTLDGITGFKLSGVAADDESGRSVASAGDVNGDGFGDLVVGAWHADPHGSNSGASYVVFGKASGFAANVDLSTLDGTAGFKLSGAAVGDNSGFSVASAGDVNGDGVADLIVGAYGADAHGTDSGASYVVFGKASGFAANVDLSTLDGTTGFKLSGAAAGDLSGISVASAGDVNGDGFADLIVGARGADPHGSTSGASYVVFGKASGFAANVDLSTLDGITGFKLSGAAAGDQSGYSVASAGDVNGDGFADLIAGALGADPHGTDSGASYVVFGALPDTAVNRTGTDAAQTLAGGNFDDTLSALGGNDTLHGNGGNDTLDGGTGADTMIGGGGNDSYRVDNVNDVVTETTGGGFDTVVAAADYIMPANAEALYMIGAGLTGTGSAGADTLLSALGGGANTLVGLGGDDLYYVSHTGDTVTETAGGGFDTVAATADYTLPANVEALYMIGAGLTGTGSAGADTLLSALGGGANTLVGLGGDDLYYVSHTGDTVTETAGGGFDTVAATADYTLPANVEALYMIGAGLTGTGSAGADTLLSALGGDANTLVGLGGDDLYYVSHTGDTVTETTGGGFDTVVATADYTLPANVEALYMIGAGLTGTGSAGADTLLSALGGGANTLVGLGGDDLYYVNNTADVVTEAANNGYDTVMASVSYSLSNNVEAMYINGSGLTGTGNSDANTLVTLGANTLIGDDGNDMFVFSAGSANGATVADFDRSEGDVLVFSGFGTAAQGATFSQIGTTDQWQLHSGLDAHNETITLANGAGVHAGDFVFV